MSDLRATICFSQSVIPDQPFGVGAGRCCDLHKLRFLLGRAVNFHALRIAPVLDMKGDAGSLNGLKVFGVPGG
jgi:hypothetical protein